MPAALLALVCAASGLLLVLLLWPRESAFKLNWLLQGSLSIGLGLGLFSIIYILSGVATQKRLLAIDFAVSALLLAASLRKRNRKPSAIIAAASFSSQKTGPTWLLLILRAAFAVAVLAALYSAVLRTIAYPHGDGWDAFAIWNLHARFLFRGGAQWRDGFTALIPWSHPDYPLLVPAAIAHFWTGMGYESQVVPALIGVAFTFSTVALLFSSLARLRGEISAILGGLTLLTTPFFTEQGTAQYADVPLSFFVLATIVLTCLHENGPEFGSPCWLPVLAGISCGFAAWTKNEGLLFLLAIVASRLFVFAIDRSRSGTPETHSHGHSTVESARKTSPSFALFLVGITPLLLLIGWFKHSVRAPNELFSSIAFHKFLDAWRYHAILKWYGKDLLRFGDWFLIPGTVLLAAVYFSVPAGRMQATNPNVRACRIAIALTLAGYFLIYLITPYDLYWHLRFSLNRLFLQLWPATIFLFFLRSPVLRNAEPVSK